MIVSDYIKNALFEHDCVIVAGFGGFLVETKAAEINPISNTLNAPSTNLAFNPSLTKDDGLLKSEISIGENISLEKANEWIKVFVEFIESELKKNKIFLLDGLGTFLQNDSKLIFTPEKKSNFNIEGFGLTNLTFEPINYSEEDMKQVRPVPPARRVVKREPVKQVETTENSTSSENKSEEKSSSGLKTLFIILPIILALGAGGFFGFKYLKNHKNASTIVNKKEDSSKKGLNEASIINTDSGSEKTYEIDQQETNSLSSTIAESTEIQSLETSNLATKAETKAVIKHNNTGSYHVIGGVFTTHKNADKFLEEHQDAQILVIDNLYKVSVASYPSLDEAVKAIPNLKTEFGSEIWVTKR